MQRDLVINLIMMVYTNLMVAQDFKSFISIAVLKILEEMLNIRQMFD